MDGRDCVYLLTHQPAEADRFAFFGLFSDHDEAWLKGEELQTRHGSQAFSVMPVDVIGQMGKEPVTIDVDPIGFTEMLRNMLRKMF